MDRSPAAMSPVDASVHQGVGFLTLNRPQALNALSLEMIRDLTRHLLAWQSDDAVIGVAIRGMGRSGPFGAFCAGGDIRFFHAAVLAGDPRLEDFFTEEYRLNHLIHHYPKPTVAFMDGIVMGGGMGLAQGCRLRIATRQTRMAMPETLIGLFPDVGGGFFLSRCPGHLGEYLGLTGEHLDGPAAVQAGLADAVMDAQDLPHVWAQLSRRLPEMATRSPGARACSWPEAEPVQSNAQSWDLSLIEEVFSAPDLRSAMVRLQRFADEGSAWASHQLAVLDKRSPLMLHVAWKQIREARTLSLADALRLERDLIRHCFHPHHLMHAGEGNPQPSVLVRSDTVEGIRALAIDKDRSPRWRHASIDAVGDQEVADFFVSPWPAHAHPLADLKD